MMLEKNKRHYYLAGFVICYLLFTICSNAQSKLDVLVIDPGHGGKDPGTLNTVSGTQEKNIVLPIALKLGELIRTRYPETKVIFTRDKDDFPSLKERTKIANDNKAKLFVSIHANHKKQEETDKSGFEIYLMNRERFSEAVGITMTENTMLQFRKAGSDTVDNFIFSSLAETGYLKYSEVLASNAEINMSRFTQLLSRGVMQQSLWVTVGASMPAVLIETGYVDDPKDEKYLTSDAGQNAIANALFNAFITYKNLYESN